MGTLAKLSRQKISTTISPEAFAFLQGLIERDEAANLAEAVDLAIQKLFAYENRERLERDTAAYFAHMTPEENAEEERFAAGLGQAAQGIDFDREP